MQTHRFNDAMTHDTMLEKVFFLPFTGVRRARCRFSILFIYISVISVISVIALCLQGVAL